MAGFFAGGFEQYRKGLRLQRAERLAQIKQRATDGGLKRRSANEWEAEQIAAEVAAVHAEYREQLSRAEGALF